MESGRTNLKINKKKFIYLISPNRITKNFYKNLKLVFKTNKVSIFQMRLKKYSMNQKMIIGKKIKNIEALSNPEALDLFKDLSELNN